MNDAHPAGTPALPRLALIATAGLLAWIYTHQLAVHPAKWEEPRRCLVAMEMIERGNAVVPHLLGEPYLNKPPFHSWLIVLFAGGAFDRVTPWAVRLVTLAALAAMALLVWRLGSSAASGARVLPALILLTTGIVVQFGRAGEIDVLFTCFVVGALAAFEFGRRRGSPWIQWIVPQVLLAAGVLTKWISPLLFYPPVLFCAWYWRRQVRLSWPALVTGFAAMAGIVAIWFVPYCLIAGGEDLGGQLADQLADRTVRLDARVIITHVATYPFKLFAVALPWSLVPLFVGAGARHAFMHRLRSDPFLGLCLATAVWCALLMLFVPGLRERYLIPMVPPVAILVAALLDTAAASGPRIRRLTLILLGLGLLYAVGFVLYAEPREAARNVVHGSTARELAGAVRPDEVRSVVVDRRVRLKLAWALSHELGHLVRRPPPSQAPYLLVAPTGTPAPAGSVRRAVAGDHELWEVGEREATSLQGEPLVRPRLPDDVRARREREWLVARQAAEAAPDDVEALIWLGRRTAYLGRYNAAIDVYTRAIERFPDEPRLFRHRGHRYITVRAFDRAIADLERAAELVAGRPDEIEPDGLPNAANVPTSTLQANIHYHLGLALYLQGRLEEAAQVYARGLRLSHHPDMLCATTHWLHMTLSRLGRTDEAQRLLEPIRAEMPLLESHAYHRLLLLYRGEIPPDALLTPSELQGAVDRTVLLYGLGNWQRGRGETEAARQSLAAARAIGEWAAFAYIAAEAELSAGVPHAEFRYGLD